MNCPPSWIIEDMHVTLQVRSHKVFILTASNQYGSETCLLFIYQLNRLQKVLNAAARVLCLASKFDHIG